MLKNARGIKNSLTKRAPGQTRLFSVGFAYGECYCCAVIIGRRRVKLRFAQLERRIQYHFSATPQHTLFAYFPGKPFQQGQSETGGRIPASACLAFCISVFGLWPGAPERHPSPILLGVSRDTPVQTPRKPKRRTRSRSAGSRYSGCVLAPQLLSPPTPICCSAMRTTVWCTGGNSYAWAAFSSSCGV